MTDIFFDIETYSVTRKPRLDDEVIAIAYKVQSGPVEVLKSWEIGEEKAIRRFMDETLTQPYPTLIGHNVLRFDTPVLVNRAALHKIGSVEELMQQLINNPYYIDLLQVLLPTNNFWFKGLRMVDCSRRLGYEHKTCDGSEIAALYEQKEYDKISAHIIEDVEANERLYRSLRDGSFYKTVSKPI